MKKLILSLLIFCSMLLQAQIQIPQVVGLPAALSGKEAKLPSTPSNPESRFLNGNKQWAEIVLGSGGYASNVYFTNLTSTIVGTYKQTSGVNDVAETIASGTCNNNEVLIHTYLFEQPVGITTIDAGVWRITLNSVIDATAGDSKFKFVQYKRSAAGVETDMFTVYSNTIENRAGYEGYLNNVFETVQPSFTVEATDRLGCRVYATTTAAGSRTLSYKVGDGFASYLNTPLALRHDQNRDKNGNPLYQHLTSTQVDKVNATSGTNTGDETLTSIKTKLGAATSVSDGYLKYQDYVKFDGKLTSYTEKDSIFQNYNKISNSIDIFPLRDGFINPLGVLEPTNGTTSVNWKCSQEIDCINTKEYFLSVPGYSGSLRVRSFDSNGTMLDSTVYFANTKLILSKNATLFVLNFRMSDSFPNVTWITPISLQQIESAFLSVMVQSKNKDFDTKNYSDKSNIVWSSIPKILLSGASFSTSNNGWFELMCSKINATYSNTAVGGTNIMDLANKLYANTLVSSIANYDVLLINHVHNKDIYSIPTKYIKYTVSDYEASGLLPFYNVTGDAEADSVYAKAYDYCIKKYKSVCLLASKTAQIIFTTHWNDSRVTFNNSIRLLSKKWNLPLIDFDKNIGFTKNILLSDGTQESVSYSVNTEVIDGVTYGWHPQEGQDKYIQKKLAEIAYRNIFSQSNHTGDVTGSTSLTLATVNSNVGTFNNVTINAKGLATAGSNVSYLTGITSGQVTTALGYTPKPTFTENTGFNKPFGTTTGTVLEGRTFGTAANSAVGDFIQNQNSSAQSANMWISGIANIGGQLSVGGRIYSSLSDSDAKRIGAQITLGNNFIGLRSGTDKSFNIDNYNDGLETNVLKITKTGAATFSSTVNSTGFLLNGNNLTSSLTTNYIPKWNGSGFINSLASDDGTTTTTSVGSSQFLKVYYSSLYSGGVTLKSRYANTYDNAAIHLGASAVNAGSLSLLTAPNDATGLVNRLTIDSDGKVSVLATTPSTSPTNGALVVGGGVGANHVRANNFYGNGSNLTGVQLPITLTTNGTSGAATFSGNVLNVPNYTSSGGVNQTQTTVNGSVNGNAICSMPFQTSTYKKVIILLGSFSGSLTYTFPTPFLFSPNIYTGAPGISPATYSITTTSLTLSGGSNTNGWVTLEGF